MKKKDDINIFIKGEDIIEKMLIINFVILCIILIYYNEQKDIINILIRIQEVIKFGLIVIVGIFVPRRILKKSKGFRYIVIYIRKHYPKFFYYYGNVLGILEGFLAFFRITQYYLERSLKYFLVGTKVKWYSPYRKYGKQGEFIVKIITEIGRWNIYIMLNIFKIYYEIIELFDTITIYSLKNAIEVQEVQVVILIFSGYILIGGKYILMFLLIGIVTSFIFNITSMYIKYQNKKTKDYDISWLKTVIDLYGYGTDINYLYNICLLNLQGKIKLFLYPIKFKNGFYYFSIKRKHEVEEAVKCEPTVAGLRWIRRKDVKLLKKRNILWYKFSKFKKENISTHQEELEISKNDILTNLYLRILGYEKSSFYTSYYTSYESTIEKMSESPLSKIELYLSFIEDALTAFVYFDEVSEEETLKRGNEFGNGISQEGIIARYYLYYGKKFFEFRDLYKFVKIIEKRKNELGYEGIKEELEKMDFFIFIKNINPIKNVTYKEGKFLLNEMSIKFLEQIKVKYDKKEYEEYVLKNYEVQDYREFKKRVGKKYDDNSMYKKNN